MGFVMAFYFATFVVILIMHEAIFPVKGQCTVQGCDNGDPLISLVAEIQQLRVDLFDQLNKQVQNIHELLNASFQELKSQHGTVMTSLQAVDRRSQEHDIYIKQGQSIHELLNESFQEMKILQAVDRRSQEHDICFKQVPSIHELLNESFQQIKSQYDSVNLSLQAVDQRLQTYQIDIENQTQKSWKLVNDICGPVSPVRDCSDIKARGYTVNGVYEVCVGHQPNRVCTNAFCDMETNNSAFLVFQRRKDGSINFSRTWIEYEQGFGNTTGEFWLGNEMLYLLTSKRNYTLRVDLEDFHGNKSFAEYARFSISSSADNYRLTIGGYSGTAGDSLADHNGKQFSTKDVDNDNNSGSCALTWSAGWWYNSCFYSNLNGIYHHQYDSKGSALGIKWYHWRGYYYSLKATEMKLVSLA